MKRLLLFLTILAPVLLSAQDAAPKQNKVGVLFMRPKADAMRDFEQNLARHNKEFHSGQNAVDIYAVLVGNRSGEFHFVYRNPTSWSGVEDGYADVNKKDHSADWDLNVAKHLSQEGPFFIFETSDESYLPADMSSFAAADKWGIYFIDINIGMEEEFFAGLKKIKEMYQKNNSKNYYFIHTRVFGKGLQIVVDFPLMKGWASFEPDPNGDWSKMFKTAFPKEDFKTWMKNFNATQKSFETMVVQHRRDLSSPM